MIDTHTKSKARLDKLTGIFNRLFLPTENTRLQPGAEEPFYQAWRGGSAATIYSREDYFSSALHEIAHWCIAGKSRRQQDDFGYWYKPEGRSAAQQLEFERVEVKPQAIELALSRACHHRFHFSADNLSQGIDASQSFKDSVLAQLKDYQINGFPERAARLIEQLEKTFSLPDAISTEPPTKDLQTSDNNE